MNRPRWFLYVIAVLTLLADQSTKWWALRALAPLHSITILPGLFNLTFVENPGVAFGLFPGYGTFISIIIIILGVSSIWLLKQICWQRISPNLIGGLLVGGAIGNLADRLRFDYVVDFLDLHLGNYASWPVFNIADSAICVSFTWMFILMLRSPEKTDKTSD